MSTLQSLFESLPAYSSRFAAGLRGNYGIRWWTYSELHDHALRVARFLASRNLTEGGRIVLLAANSPEWLACLFGATIRGLVVVPLDPETPLSQLASIVDETQAELILTDLADLQVQSDISVWPLGRIPRHIDSQRGLTDLMVPATPDRAAVILYTSGATGNPRGIILTHDNLMVQVNRFGRWRHLLRFVPLRLLAVSPLSHIQGLLLGGCLPLRLGMSVIYTRNVAPEHLINTIRVGRASILLCVPRVLRVLEELLWNGRHERSSEPLETRSSRCWFALTRRRLIRRSIRFALGRRFQMIFVGGATLSQTSEDFWKRAGCILIQGYGSTETSALVTINFPWGGRRGSIGRAVHTDSIRIADDGEILVRGPHVAHRVVGSNGHDPASFMGKSDDGFYGTGDLAELDSAGRIYFLGRKDDMIVTAEGHNVHPAAIESVLDSESGVQQSVVTSIASDDLVRIHAVVVPKAGEDIAVAVRNANARLPPLQRIQSWETWDERDFPRKRLGKLDRRAVRHSVEVDQKSDPTSACGKPDGGPQSIDDCLAIEDPVTRIDSLATFLRPKTGGLEAQEVAKLVENLELSSIEAIRLLTKLTAVESPESPPAGSVALKSSADGTASGTPGDDLSEERSPPRWQTSPIAGAVRGIVRPCVLPLLSWWSVRVSVRGVENIPADGKPCVFAIAQGDRNDAYDFLALYRALPSKIARKLMLVIAARPLFESYLYPEKDERLASRIVDGFMFHLGIPVCLPYSLVFPSRSVSGSGKGLTYTAFWIDNRFCPAATWGEGIAEIAKETGTPVVPVGLFGNKTSSDGQRDATSCVEVTFGAVVEAEDHEQTSLFDSVNARLLSLKQPSIS